uniref:Uncharacterized protein n=1 Tax=Anopheles quadriannulatus TaxID=34691 RepID=A0A182XTR7_ANOQN
MTTVDEFASSDVSKVDIVLRNPRATSSNATTNLSLATEMSTQPQDDDDDDE